MLYTLRYGENPQSTAELIKGSNEVDNLSLFNLENPDGTPLDFSSFSYINISDTDRMLNTMVHTATAFSENEGHTPKLAFAVKHGHICGGAVSDDAHTALRKMYEGDKRAVFGGFIMTNFEIDEKAIATLLDIADGKMFLAGIIAPKITKEAIAKLPKQKRKCQLACLPGLSELNTESLNTEKKKRPIRGGYILENRGEYVPNTEELSPGLDKETRANLLLSWAVGSTSVSNTITIVNNSAVIGNGVGQQDRVGACELAIKRALDAGHAITGATAYSDSFFPFSDGIEVLQKAGIKTVFATSGSIKDKIVKKYAAENNINLILAPDKKVRGFFGH